MSRLARDGTAEPVSRDQIIRHVRGQGNIHFPCSADHEQDWQPYPVDPYSAVCDDHTNIHILLYLVLYLVCLQGHHLLSKHAEQKKVTSVRLPTPTRGQLRCLLAAKPLEDWIGHGFNPR